MPFEEEQANLMGVVSWVAPMKQIIQTSASGKQYIRLYNYFEALPFQYESGAILGRAMRNKLSTFEKMLSTPYGTEGQTAEDLQNSARERLNRYREDATKEPDTFYELIFKREIENATGLSLDDYYEAGIRKDKKTLEKMLKVFNENVEVAKAAFGMRVFGLEGIGFGSSFPELTERMYKNAYENVDMDMWAKAKEMSVDIPEKPDFIPLERREGGILTTTAAYAAKFYPELLDPLDLRDYVA